MSIFEQLRAGAAWALEDVRVIWRAPLHGQGSALAKMVGKGEGARSPTRKGLQGPRQALLDEKMAPKRGLTLFQPSSRRLVIRSRVRPRARATALCVCPCPKTERVLLTLMHVFWGMLYVEPAEG